MSEAGNKNTLNNSSPGVGGVEYNFREIEKKWQEWWKENKVYKVSNESPKPKCYVLDMFPYPSGVGLHVGHPLGYIASDIYSRFKRLKGFNVLHPMGYDAFGLPAEQYALDHGIHPAVSTAANIKNFRSQLDKIGFCFDWDREVNTSKPEFYKWTQWIFLQLFGSFYNRKTQKAERIEHLIAAFEKEGNKNHPLPDSKFEARLKELELSNGIFSAKDWNSFGEETKQAILMEYRLAYCGIGEVNWCEALGTVLANDEVINGLSERGGHPVVKKKLRQWYLRITEYADRLLESLQQVDFSEAMKEMQGNWIGKSSGAEIDFDIEFGETEWEKTEHSFTQGDSVIVETRITETKAVPESNKLRVYTTRPDTIFGVDFMVVAPEHELIDEIITDTQRSAVDEYIAYVNSRSERERMAEKKITGVFTGSYAIHPFNHRRIPIWISEYVLAGYGTGAIMAVPCGDERDHKFAKNFGIPITNIIGSHYNGEEANPTKDAHLENSDFLDGLVMRDAIEIAIKKIEEKGIGIRKVNFKMRDAAFSRQRYWGEPFPIIWKDGIAYPLDEKELPLLLPHVDSYKAGPEGEGPLANIKDWALIPDPSPQAEKGAARVPKYSVHTPTQYEYAKLMRKEYTEAEGKLWELLRGNRVGIKFRRQHPIESYIADFVSLQDRLIVEVDGGYHETEEQKKYDAERTKVLNEIGFKVIRFSNQQILENVFSVRDKIKLELEAQNPSPRLERGGGVRETNTMPGYAGSSWYFLRYMDPQNDGEFCNRKASDYWGQVDLYIGGTEHAVGHLLYSRMWTKFLYDMGLIGHDEPYRRLVNQGMIQGSSRFVYRIHGTNKFVSSGMKEQYQVDPLHVDVNIVDGLELDIELFKQWRNGEYMDAQFILEDGKYICGAEVEKMSKSKFNTVNPDDLVIKYGADTFRMYEMFLGPVEMSKPWDTKGIEGVHRFLKKLWRLASPPALSQGEGASEAELKVLHRLIKKIEEDTERFSFNTGVSAFMIAVNDLTDLRSHKKEILEPLLILLAPYAPHIAEELWHHLGNSGTILNAAFPKLEEKFLVESSKEYPVSINGKMRTTIDMALGIPESEVEKIVLANAVVQKWLEGKPPKKIIYKEGKMVNVVV